MVLKGHLKWISNTPLRYENPSNATMQVEVTKLTFKLCDSGREMEYIEPQILSGSSRNDCPEWVTQNVLNIGSICVDRYEKWWSRDSVNHESFPLVPDANAQGHIKLSNPQRCKQLLIIRKAWLLPTRNATSTFIPRHAHMFVSFGNLLTIFVTAFYH